MAKVTPSLTEFTKYAVKYVLNFKPALTTVRPFNPLKVKGATEGEGSCSGHPTDPAACGIASFRQSWLSMKYRAGSLDTNRRPCNWRRPEEGWPPGGGHVVPNFELQSSGNRNVKCKKH